MRPYTGTADAPARGKREGLEHLVEWIKYLSGGKAANWGTFTIRKVKGGLGAAKNALSVHATGRAADVAFPKETRAYLESWAKVLTRPDVAEALGIELVIDYSYTKGLGGGRGWSCTREAWKDYKPGQIGSGGQAGSKWLHVEIDPAHADSKALIDEGIKVLIAALGDS